MTIRILAIIGLVIMVFVMTMILPSCQTQADKPLSAKKKEKILAPMQDPDFQWPDHEIWPIKKLPESEKPAEGSLDQVRFTQPSSEGSEEPERPNQLAPKDGDGIYSILPRGWSSIEEPYIRRV